MKSILSSLMAVFFMVGSLGCASGESGNPSSSNVADQVSQNIPPQAPHQKNVNSLSSGGVNTSGEFFMAVRLTDEIQNIQLFVVRDRLPDSTATSDQVLRAPSSIFLGSVVPDKIEILFLLPPGIEASTEDTVKVHYGCRNKGGPDIYPTQAEILSLSFDSIAGIPGGAVTSANLRMLFYLCGKKAISVFVEFRDKAGAVQAWEKIYLESGTLAKAK